jgi:hypothetical protein
MKKRWPEYVMACGIMAPASDRRMLAVRKIKGQCYPNIPLPDSTIA